MDTFIGFLLGVATSIVAEGVVGLVKTRFPRVADHKIMLAAARPVRYFRHRRRGREALAVIDRLFLAWEQKDEDAYRDCWHPDAMSIVGGYFQEPWDLDRIMEQFRASCDRYATIRVDYVTKETIEMDREGTKAKVAVRYGFTVERPNGLEAREQGRERYGIVCREGKWAIASNWDRSDVS